MPKINFIINRIEIFAHANIWIFIFIDSCCCCCCSCSYFVDDEDDPKYACCWNPSKIIVIVLRIPLCVCACAWKKRWKIERHEDWFEKENMQVPIWKWRHAFTWNDDPCKFFLRSSHRECGRLFCIFCVYKNKTSETHICISSPWKTSSRHVSFSFRQFGWIICHKNGQNAFNRWYCATAK